MQGIYIDEDCIYIYIYKRKLQSYLPESQHLYVHAWKMIVSFYINRNTGSQAALQAALLLGVASCTHMLLHTEAKVVCADKTNSDDFNKILCVCFECKAVKQSKRKRNLRRTH